MGYSSTKKTILIVDDTRTNRVGEHILLGRPWEKKGHPVIECEDGQEAMEAVRRIGIENVALVMTDGNMPRMDGVQLVAALREEGKALPYRLPIIMISSDEERLKAVDPASQPPERSVDALVGKPFDIAQVGQMVNGFMERPSAIGNGEAAAQAEPTQRPPTRLR